MNCVEALNPVSRLIPNRGNRMQRDQDAGFPDWWLLASLRGLKYHLLD